MIDGNGPPLLQRTWSGDTLRVKSLQSKHSCVVLTFSMMLFDDSRHSSRCLACHSTLFSFSSSTFRLSLMNRGLDYLDTRLSICLFLVVAIRLAQSVDFKPLAVLITQLNLFSRLSCRPTDILPTVPASNYSLRQPADTYDRQSIYRQPTEHNTGIFTGYQQVSFTAYPQP